MSGSLVRVVMCVSLYAVARAGGADPAPEIQARYWFNNPVFRLHDDRTVVLWFFSLKDRRRSGELEQTVRALRRVAANPRVVVIGLTPDRRSAAQRFIRKYRVPFTIGAGSRSHRDFGVRRLPALLRIDRRGRSEPEPLTVEELSSLEPDYGQWQPSDLSRLTTPWQLRALIESEADGRIRRAAVARLYELSEAREFARWAEGQVSREPDPWVRGALDMYRDRALGVERRDDEPSPSAAAYRQYRANPDVPEWESVRQFIDQTRNTQQLVEQLARHGGDAPADLVIRRLAVESLSLVSEQERPVARKALMELLVDEPDPSVRLLAVMALSEVCEPGDEEVASLLDALARREPNTYRVRPMMEYISYYLRTGDEDVRNMPSPVAASP